MCIDNKVQKEKYQYISAQMGIHIIMHISYGCSLSGLRLYICLLQMFWFLSMVELNIQKFISSRIIHLCFYCRYAVVLGDNISRTQCECDNVGGINLPAIPYVFCHRFQQVVPHFGQAELWIGHRFVLDQWILVAVIVVYFSQQIYNIYKIHIHTFICTPLLMYLLEVDYQWRHCIIELVTCHLFFHFIHPWVTLKQCEPVKPCSLMFIWPEYEFKNSTCNRSI